jgi:type IV pilus assembly protein PilB
MPATAQSILTALVSDGRLSQAQADTVMTESLSTGSPAEDILLKKRLISDVDLSKAKAASVNIPFVTLSGRAITPAIVNFISEPVARRYSLIPFEFDEEANKLSVAMEDPLDFQVLEFIEKKSGKQIRPFMALKEDILGAIDETYSQNLGEDVTAALKESVEPEVKTYEAGRLGEVIREAPIAQIVSATLEQAIHLRASDVHIEPQIGDTRVRYRVDGILEERLVLPKRLHDAVVSRIKIISDMKIDEKRVPQDGRFNFKMGDQEVDLRVSTLPTVHGEKIVMRLLKKSGGIPTMSELGLRGLALNILDAQIARPHGIILVTGPTGSGKTTTLYAVLSKLNNARVNIMTLEDPVEYEISGVNQVQINPGAGLTFATGLRSFLRQDPNIILVGEVRDRETTDLAIQAALTGHTVFSTLHTNNAAGAIPRLLDLGAEPFLIVSSLNALVGQRIARKICPTCKEEYEPEETVKKDVVQVLGALLPKDKPMKLYRGKGTVNGSACTACGGTGYLERIGIFEVLPISSEIAQLIATRASMEDLEKIAVGDGMITMKQDGYMKALEGTTTIEEVLRVAQD